MFAHTCTIFFERGIARPETKEISSLSCEEAPDESIVITLFEVEATPAAIEVGRAASLYSHIISEIREGKKKCLYARKYYGHPLIWISEFV